MTRRETVIAGDCLTQVGVKHFIDTELELQGLEG